MLSHLHSTVALTGIHWGGSNVTQVANIATSINKCDLGHVLTKIETTVLDAEIIHCWQFLKREPYRATKTCWGVLFLRLSLLNLFRAPYRFAPVPNVFVFLPLCVCMQDGVKSLEEAMSYNTSITELDIRLTEASEQSASVIMQAVLANQQGLEQKKSAQPGEIK